MARKKFPDCPKCGQDEPEGKYHNSDGCYWTYSNSLRGEHFDLRCYRCRHKWQAPFDLPLEPEPVQGWLPQYTYTNLEGG